MIYNIHEKLNEILISGANFVKIVICKSVQGQMRSTFHGANKDQSPRQSASAGTRAGQERAD